jgi:sugar phosphate isomerase/epimerase
MREERICENGVFEFRFGADDDQAPWRFTSVGDGHSDSYWLELLNAVRRCGYDGPASIEYEEPPPRDTESIEAGIERSITALRRILASSDAAPRYRADRQDTATPSTSVKGTVSSA